MWRTMGYTGSVGLELAAYFVVPYMFGQWLDRKWGTGPWLGYFFLAAGIGAAIKALVRVTRVYKRSLQKEDAAPPPDKPPTG
jgi:F0F1-type ATP synthase assembly protein I